VCLLVEWSDSLGSGVKLPPLIAVEWIVVSDSQSELVSSDIFFPEQSSMSSHS
jgi:hypothetical protein